MLKNRIHALRAILTCLSGPLYISPEGAPVPNRWLRFFSEEENNTKAWEMFCSVLNASVTYDPVGWGMPYNYWVSSGAVHEEFSEVSLHLLLVLLDRSRAGEDANLFRIFQKALGREIPSELGFLYDHISALLENPLVAKRSYLPGSAKAIQSSQELSMLLWTLLTLNQVGQRLLPHSLTSNPLRTWLVTSLKRETSPWWQGPSSITCLIPARRRVRNASEAAG